MNGFLLAAFISLPAFQARAEPPTAPRPRPNIGVALRKLAEPCPDRVHINEALIREEGARFCYRPFDLYDDCADEMHSLAKTTEPLDDRLLKQGLEAKEMPERYRTAWVLIQRRSAKAVPIIEKMSNSESAEERYLAWHLYSGAVHERQIAAPKSFDDALSRCKAEKNHYVRATIMSFLGSCRAKAAIPYLMSVVDDDPGYAAVHTLGQIGAAEAAPVLIKQAKKVTLNRHIYFAALGRIGSQEAVDYLLERIDEGCFVVEALFESGSPKALPVLENYLDRLKAQKNQDDLDLATTQVSVLRLKYTDPREQLLTLAEDTKQSNWMRTRALEALRHYDAKPLTARIVKLYRAEKNDWMRMDSIRLLHDLPGEDVTKALIEQALSDDPKVYHHSHTDLLSALNARLGTSFRTMPPLVEYLKREGGNEK